GFAVGYGPANTMGNNTTMFPGPTLNQGVNKVKDFIPVARIADMLLHPNEKFQYNGKEHSYPDIRLIYWAGGNPFHHHQDLNRLWLAWKRPETIVVNEQYWTANAKMADIVLPATTSFEREDIAYAKRERYMTFMSKLHEPMHEAKSDYEIFAMMAEKLKVGEAFTEGLDSAAWIERLYEQSRADASAHGINLPAFQAFKQLGLVDLQQLKKPTPVVMLSDFRSDPEKHPLTTPSGKIEIFSATIDSYQLDDCAGHPKWYPPREWLDAANNETQQFHLITDQPLNKLHSQLNHSPISKGGKIHGREPVVIHKADAQRLNLLDGDIVRVFNQRGACLATVVLTENLRQGVVKISTGAWFDPHQMADGQWLDVHGNPNVLTRDQGASGLSQGCAAQSCLVSIEPYQGEAPAVSAFLPPRFVNSPSH
ncbi:MAG TPA: molybdopterin dinucleotide binding domain-containing protein, partial [Pusillimonas sp.]